MNAFIQKHGPTILGLAIGNVIAAAIGFYDFGDAAKISFMQCAAIWIARV